MKHSSDEDQRIVKTVINGMLAVDEDSACMGKILREIYRFIDGRTNQATACAAVEDELESKGLLVESERVVLCIETASSLVCGYHQWLAGQEPMALWQFPAWELVKCYPRTEPLLWATEWQRHGGRLLLNGRMIALKDSSIGNALSKFGLLFPPFDLGSGLRWREMARAEAVALGLVSGLEIPDSVGKEFAQECREDAEQFTVDELKAALVELRSRSRAEPQLETSECVEDLVENAGPETGQGVLDVESPPPRRAVLIAPVNLEFADSFKRRVAFYFGHDGRQDRLRVALEQGTALDLFWLAQEQSSNPAGIIKLLERALEMGFGQDRRQELRASRMLIDAYKSLGLVEKFPSHRVKHLELLKATIAEGMPVERNDRADACGEAAEILQDFGKHDEAARYRELRIENQDGFSLLADALHQLESINPATQKGAAETALEMLTKAAGKIPEVNTERHAEIYRATGEILKAWGDTAQAIEYYEYALQKNPRVGVKRRLEALRKSMTGPAVPRG